MNAGPLHTLCELSPQPSSSTAPKHLELNSNMDWDS